MAKKYYIISTPDLGFKGYSTCKDHVDEFFRQRGNDYYELHVFKEKQLDPKFIEEMVRASNELSMFEGRMIFFDEEEYLTEYISQYFTDVRFCTRYMKDKLKFVRLSSEEECTLMSMFRLINSKIDKADCTDWDSDELADDYDDDPHDTHLQLGKILDVVIDDFG